ncbi:MAG: DUF418 domain-containing protein [Sandaracinaceae bacterium]
MRLRGYDLARAFAILGMIVINVQVFLLSREDHGVIAPWLAHLPSGHASGLFVTLAGVGIGLMDAGADRRAVRWVLLRRSLFLFIGGNALILVWPIDILHFYAFYLSLTALLLLPVPHRGRLPIAALVALAAPLLLLLFPDVERPREDAYWTPLGMLQNVVGWGIHPVLPWLAFVPVGQWIAEYDFTDCATRTRLMTYGAAAAVLGPFASIALELVFAHTPSLYGTRWFVGAGWSPHPLYILTASGTSLFAIGAAFSIEARFGRMRLVRWLVVAGQLSLSVYVFHALVGIGLGRWVFNWSDRLSLPLAMLWALAVCMAAVVTMVLFRRVLPRGPLELLMRLFGGRTPPRDAMPPRRRLDRIAPAWIGAAALFAGALLLVRTAAPLDDPGCPGARGLGTSAVGTLSLRCTDQVRTFTLTEASEVTLETHSALDLYLELRDASGETVAENDDGGERLNAKIVRTLEPGDYRVRVRPFRTALGSFALTRLDGPPRAPTPGCADTCESANDGECDDGGPDSLFDVCALGTDCADCGVRPPSPQP